MRVPVVWATPDAMRLRSASTRARVWGRKVRTVPLSRTVSGITLLAVPPLIWHRLTTTGSSGELMRLAML